LLRDPAALATDLAEGYVTDPIPYGDAAPPPR
jgi:hypothetical protein